MLRNSIATRTEFSVSHRLFVLIVDPAISGHSELVRTLEDEGFDVLIAPDLEAARQFVVRETISYVLLELRLPDGSPFELIKEIKDRHPRSRVLVHSAYCNVPTAVRATKAGATDVLPKPVDMRFVMRLLLGEDYPFADVAGQLPCPDAVRKEHIRVIYTACNRNVARAARELSMHRRTLQRLLIRTGMGL
jgi:two-component system response regulator RegA